MFADTTPNNSNATTTGQLPPSSFLGASSLKIMNLGVELPADVSLTFSLVVTLAVTLTAPPRFNLCLPVPVVERGENQCCLTPSFLMLGDLPMFDGLRVLSRIGAKQLFGVADDPEREQATKP